MPPNSSTSLFFSKPPLQFQKIIIIRRRSNKKKQKQSMGKSNNKSKKKKTFMTSLLSKPTQFLCYTPPLATWPWPSCKHPRTSSFRCTNPVGESVYKTVNTVYDHDAVSVDSATEVDLRASPSLNVDVRSIRSDRLIFEPAAGSVSGAIVQKSPQKEKANNKDRSSPFKESIVMALDSADPYRDFRESMQEMVAAHGIKDWDGLEKLLGMYLRLNAKTTHGLIVGAFVDLLVAMAAGSAAASPNYNSSCSTVTFDEIGEMVEHFG